MLRAILTLAGRAGRAARPSLSLLTGFALGVVAPGAARATVATAAPEPELIVEALFLCDPLPPGGRDLGLVVAGTPDGSGALALEPHLQLSLALGARLGLTADVLIEGGAGGGPRSPAVGVKALLRDPAAGGPGVGASLDLLADDGMPGGVEAALGLGVIAPVGRFALRASATVGTPVGAFAPHLHAGASAALAIGGRWRVLGEAVVTVGGGTAIVTAGPAVKVALDPKTSLAAGAMLEVARPDRTPSFAVQLVRAL